MPAKRRRSARSRSATRRTDSKRKTKRRSSKIASMIVSAIRDLKDPHGSTRNKIVGYISYASDQSDGVIKKQVKTGLNRVLRYGLVKRYRGRYFLPSGANTESDKTSKSYSSRLRDNTQSAQDYREDCLNIFRRDSESPTNDRTPRNRRTASTPSKTQQS